MSHAMYAMFQTNTRTLLTLSIFCILSKVSYASGRQKLIYEKDLSEHCRRRVIPSVFMGRHVVEATAHVLHFSRLELPYNCYISVRSESGCNIIMVIQLSPGDNLERPCAYSPQLLVYELGETFGGYWGPLPESMLKQNPQLPKFYTLQTTQPTTSSVEETTTEEYTETTTPTSTFKQPPQSEDFVRLEVPIVEVSGQLVPGELQPLQQEAFDIQDDVTPKPGEEYETSILPLVKFSLRPHKKDDGRRDDGEELRYDLDYVHEFTPDRRLRLPQFTSPKSYIKKHRANVNRRISFATNATSKMATRRPFHNYRKLRLKTTRNNKFTKYVFPTIKTTNIEYKFNNERISWDMIDNLLDKLDKNKDITHDKEDPNSFKIMENISKMKHNVSIYLAENLTRYNDSKSENTITWAKKRQLFVLNDETTEYTTNKTQDITILHSNSTPTSSYTNQIPTTSVSDVSNKTSTTVAITKTENYEDSDGLDINIKKSLSDLATISNNVTVSLVDHESWENIVQVAPEMAVLLNHTVSYETSKNDLSSLNGTYKKDMLDRKKREIHPISIENAHPHNITTKAKVRATTTATFNIADMQEFARMVELQDDEIQGRVALRYLRQYVGPELYNICNDTQQYNQRVYLFNTSRIVLALNNFTLKQMSIIITVARTLSSGELQCPNSQLECQVAGARVCVDSMTACDGVPNCGSYEIYDEDRLVCGAAKGLQSHVYIAAFTFLALLLTLFYGIHYWLKRCVPKVAEAFFIFTGGDENILNLKAIMKPPGDNENGSKMFYRPDMFSEPTSELDQRKDSFWSRLLRKCCICCRKKEEKKEDDIEHELFNSGRSRKVYSFTEMEIVKMLGETTVDTSVQTGDSLEMALIKKSNLSEIEDSKIPHKGIKEKTIETKHPPIMIQDSLITLDEPLPEDVLSLMPYGIDSRSSSIISPVIKQSMTLLGDDTFGRLFESDAMQGPEKVISSITYDGKKDVKPGPSGKKPNSKVTKKGSKKVLRFEEGATTIPSNYILDNEEQNTLSRHQRRYSSSFRPRTFKSHHLGTIKEDEEQSGLHRYTHFWESKGKKAKHNTK